MQLGEIVWNGSFIKLVAMTDWRLQQQVWVLKSRLAHVAVSSMMVSTPRPVICIYIYMWNGCTSRSMSMCSWITLVWDGLGDHLEHSNLQDHAGHTVNCQSRAYIANARLSMWSSFPRMSYHFENRRGNTYWIWANSALRRGRMNIWCLYCVLLVRNFGDSWAWVILDVNVAVPWWFVCFPFCWDI